MPEETFAVKKNPDGTCTVSLAGFSETVHIRALTPEKKIEAVKKAILALGAVYTDEIERMVVRELFP
jgi:hypothetical protein